MTKKTKKKKRGKLPTGIGENEVVIPFEEKFKWPDTHKRVTFDGPQFQEWIHQTLPVSRELKPMDHEKAKTDGVKLDEFVFYMRPLPMWRWGSRYENVGYFMPFLDTSPPIEKRCCLELYRNRQAAYCAFSSVIDIPVLAKPGPVLDGSKLEPWMSLTPNEVLTQRGQIRRAKKDTAMAGLGLGWAARKVLERKQVKHLTVYEKSQAIIDYFGESLAADYPDKVTLVCADAYEVDWQQHDVSLWDIWEDWGGAAWDRKFEKIRMELEADGKVCVGWGQGVSTT
jgi:hypothetical protein